MKKALNIFLAILIAVFAFPVNGIQQVAAEGKVYEIEYVINHETKDETSYADRYFLKPATLIENGENFLLQLPIVDWHYVDWIKQNGKELTILEETETTATVQLEVSGNLSDEVPLTMQITVPDIYENQVHDVRLILDPDSKQEAGTGDDSNNEQEEPEEPTSPDDTRVVGSIISEEEADYVYEVNFETESSSTSRQLENPVKILLKDGSKYIQIKVKGVNYFRSLTFNDEEVVWSSVKNSTATIQYEIEAKDKYKPIESIDLDVSMIIETPMGTMKHGAAHGKDPISITFDSSSLSIPDKRIEGQLLKDSEADYVYEYKFDTKSKATKDRLGEDAKVLVKDGKKYVQIGIKKQGNLFRSLTFNGKEAIWSSLTDSTPTIQFDLSNRLTDDIEVSMVIYPGMMDPMFHGGIQLSNNLSSISIEDKRIVNTNQIIAEKDADTVQYYEIATNNDHAERNFGEHVKVLEKDSNKYLQLDVFGVEHFRSFTFNSEEVVWKSIEDSSAIVQYELGTDELPSNESKSIDLSMIIAPENWEPMYHKGIKLWLGDKVNLIKLGKKTKIESDEKILISEGSHILPPSNLPAGVELTITSQTESVKTVGSIGDLEVAGEVYHFNFENLGEITEPFTLVFEYDSKFDNKDYEVDIYYFNPKTGEWEAQGGHVENGKVSVQVDHFSVYGVFAKHLITDVVKDINYIIYQENEDKKSVADQYFDKPAKLVERNGKQFLQFSINRWDFVDWLQQNGNNITPIELSGTNALIELEITGNLPIEIPLEMQITVPGFYEDQKHSVRFVVLDEEETKVNPPKQNLTEEPVKKPTQSKETDKIQVDKAYEIDYVIYQESKNEKSYADQYFVKPGTLLESGGKRYLQFTITDWNYIDWLRYNNKNVLIIKEDKANNTVVAQIEITGNLSDEIPLTMQITVPGIYENQQHNARLVLDPDSLKEIDAKGLYVYKDVNKPNDFGKADGDNGSGKKESGNPKTGDTSQVWFFTILLVASLIPLVINLRRRVA